jgi:hypothetical protein
MMAVGNIASLPSSESRTTPRLYFVCGLGAVLILLSDLAIPLGVAMGVPYVAVVLLSLWSPQKRFTVFVAVVSSVLTVGAVFLQEPIAEMWKVVFNRGLALFAIWVTAALGLQIKIVEKNRQKAWHEREEALEKLKILGGLLPICSSCKRIRDDRGCWTQVENYVKEHSEADFTHGICPECAKKLYPEIHEEKRGDSDTGQ